MLIVTTVFAIAAVAAAFGTGFLLGRYAFDGEDPGIKAECSKLRCDIEAFTKGLRNAAVSLSAAKEENADLAKRVAGLTRHYLDQTERMRAIDELRADAESRSKKLELEIALLKERGRQLAAKVTEQLKVTEQTEVTEQATEVLDTQRKLTSELKNIPIRAQKAPSGELSSRQSASTFRSGRELGESRIASFPK